MNHQSINKSLSIMAKITDPHMHWLYSNRVS